MFYRMFVFIALAVIECLGWIRMSWRLAIESIPPAIRSVITPRETTLSLQSSRDYLRRQMKRETPHIVSIYRRCPSV